GRKLPSLRGKSPHVRGFADFYQRFFGETASQNGSRRWSRASDDGGCRPQTRFTSRRQPDGQACGRKWQTLISKLHGLREMIAARERRNKIATCLVCSH